MLDMVSKNFRLSSTKAHPVCGTPVVNVLVHHAVPIHRVFSFRLDCNTRSDYVVQSSSSILGGQLFFDGFQGPVPLIVIDHWLPHSLLEAHFMSLLVMVYADQNQINSVHHGLPLNSLHVFQIINTKLQVFSSPD
jgi:hypothetical protein